MNTKRLIIVFLLLAYGTSFVVTSFILSKKEGFNMLRDSARGHAPENSDLPSSIPLPTEQEPLDTEDNFSEDDENLLALSSISFVRYTDFISFHHLNSPILSGSFNPPFSPPEFLA